MKHTIHVTPEDIKSGRPGLACDCPVAIAIQRVGFSNASIYGNDLCDLRPRIYIPSTPITKFQKIPLDDSVWRRIEHYDRTREMEPFSFEIEI